MKRALIATALCILGCSGPTAPTPGASTPQVTVQAAAVTFLPRADPPAPAATSGTCCHPPLFNPGEHTITTNSDGDFVFVQEGGDPCVISNGVELEVNAPDSRVVRRWSFGCASTAEHTLEITTDGKRSALFTHIHAYELSPERDQLAMYNEVLTDAGWQKRMRIIDLGTLERAEVEGCMGQPQEWDANGLLFTNERDGGVLTDVCLTDSEGKWIGSAALVVEYPGWVERTGLDTFVQTASPVGHCDDTHVDVRRKLALRGSAELEDNLCRGLHGWKPGPADLLPVK